MDIKIMNRLNGYNSHFNGRFLLLHRNLLSDSEYILWDLGYSCLADWDKSHGEIYGSFEYTQEEIAWLLGWSPSKVSRRAGELVSLGLWRKQGKRIYVLGFELRDCFADIAKEGKVIDLQKELAKMQPAIAKKQEPDAKLQEKTSKENESVPPQTHAVLQEPNSKESLVSFKNECNGYRSDEEYQKIWEENPDGMSTENMKLADEAIWETMGICPHGGGRYEKAIY